MIYNATHADQLNGLYGTEKLTLPFYFMYYCSDAFVTSIDIITDRLRKPLANSRAFLFTNLPMHNLISKLESLL